MLLLLARALHIDRAAADATVQAVMMSLLPTADDDHVGFGPGVVTTGQLHALLGWFCKMFKHTKTFSTSV